MGGEIKPVASSIYSGGTVVCIKQTEYISMAMEADNEATVGHIYSGGIVASEKQTEYLSIGTQAESVITIQAVYNMAAFVVADTQNISIL